MRVPLITIRVQAPGHLGIFRKNSGLSYWFTKTPSFPTIKSQNGQFTNLFGGGCDILVLKSKGWDVL